MKAGMNGQSDGPNRNMDVDVKIREDTKSGDVYPIEEEKFDPDLTESSSSFDSDGTSFSENEVDPELSEDALSELRLDAYYDVYRMKNKKSLRWKKYIGQLAWRCKWIELQINKFNSQARKYDSQVAAYDAARKQSEENVNSKSLPFSPQIRRGAMMKRKKRRRAEDTEELASYMRDHNLFSYFEKKKSVADVACTDGNNGCIEGAGAERTSPGTNQILMDEELLFCEDKDGRSSLEDIFWKIGVMQGQVREMKTRVRKVLNDSVRFRSTESLSLHVSYDNMLTNSAQNPASNNNNEDNLATPSSISVQILHDNIDSDAKMVDVAMVETADSRLGEVNNSKENMKRVNPLPVRESSSNPSRPLLTYNRRAKTTSYHSKEVHNVPVQMPQPPDEYNQDSSIIRSSQALQPSSQSMCSMGNMMTTTTTGRTECIKKKRAMRKAGFGKWK